MDHIQRAKDIFSVTDKPLLAMERAHKIARHLNLMPEAPWVSPYLSDVASEIGEAERNAVEESHKQHNEKVLDVVRDIKRDAYLEAAKIAEQHWGCTNIECIRKSCSIVTATQIRAKVKELKDEGTTHLCRCEYEVKRILSKTFLEAAKIAKDMGQAGLGTYCEFDAAMTVVASAIIAKAKEMK